MLPSSGAFAKELLCCCGGVVAMELLCCCSSGVVAMELLCCGSSSVVVL